MNDTQSLAHTTWNCKYHIVFAPKYRRKVFYGQKRREIGAILRQLCEWKGVEIIEAEVCPDHVHMCVKIPPKMSVSGFMGFLKGKKRKKQCNNIQQVCKYEIQISEQRVLVPWLLCRHGRKECKEDKGIHSEPTCRR